MEKWEVAEQLLWRGVYKSPLSLVPSSSLKIKTVDEDTLVRWSDLFALDSSIIILDDNGLWPCSVLDLVQSPSLLESGNLLLHGS